MKEREKLSEKREEEKKEGEKGGKKKRKREKDLAKNFGNHSGKLEEIVRSIAFRSNDGNEIDSRTWFGSLSAIVYL